MKKFKFTKENIVLTAIVILSAILNFANLSIEGYGNSYYASAVKSMTMSFKNFFFVSFDPAGFVTIDKPPLGFWLQAISAKIFGFSGVSILLPSALAGVISVILVHHLVKKVFGSAAGLLSALFLAITPVFVAVSRNNTIDNILIMFLLLALWALSVAAEKGSFKYLMLCMVFIGLGFNVKMVEAYLIVPAVYVMYLLSSKISLKKRITHLVVGTIILLAVSFSWAVAVDLVPASSRPYVDSSTNNTVTELILGHNGSERLSFGSSSNGGMGGGAPNGGGKAPSQNQKGSSKFGPSSSNSKSNSSSSSAQGQKMPGGIGQMGPMSGNKNQGGTQGGSQGSQGAQQGGQGGSSGQLQGTFGGQVTAGVTRLFLKSILSDQIVWFIPLAIFGFIATALKEKLRFKLDNKRKQSIAVWFLWFLPEFIYFSFNTGTFHSYYLTMLAPPTAALAGIGLTSLVELYKGEGWEKWLLPAALLATSATHLLMLYYFIDYSIIVKVLIGVVSVLTLISAIALIAMNVLKKNGYSLKENLDFKFKNRLAALVIVAIIVTPLVGSSTVLFNKLNGSFPAAGLELLSSASGGGQPGGQGSSQSGTPKMKSKSSTAQSKNNSKISGASNNGMSEGGDSNSKLIEFLEKNKTSKQKYLLVVSNSNSASDIIISTGESVMSLGGFLGNDNIVSLAQFKQMVKNGEIRYVMTGGQGNQGSQSEIFTWVKKAGKLVDSSKYRDNAASNNTSTTTTKNSKNSNSNSMDGQNSQQQLYDLKSYTDSFKK